MLPIRALLGGGGGGLVKVKAMLLLYQCQTFATKKNLRQPDIKAVGVATQIECRVGCRP